MRSPRSRRGPVHHAAARGDLLPRTAGGARQAGHRRRLIAWPARRSSSHRRARRRRRRLSRISWSRGQCCGAAGRRPALRAAAGNGSSPRRCPTPAGATAGIPRKVLGVSAGWTSSDAVWGAGSQRDACACARTQARQATADVHQARRVAGRHRLGPGGEHVPHLVGEHRRGRVSVLEREGPPKPRHWSASGSSTSSMLAHLAQQPQRLVADPKHPQRVAGRVVGDPVRDFAPTSVDAKDVDEQFGQLVGRGRDGGGPRGQVVQSRLRGCADRRVLVERAQGRRREPEARPPRRTPRRSQT